MTTNLLLDIGGLVSLLDRSQSRHREFAAFYGDWRGPVVTTEAVLTESSHLLSRVPYGVENCLKFVLEGGATLIPATAKSLASCLLLVRKYSDLPMDFADASLVCLAEELATGLVLTTNRRGFSVYRWAGREPFEIVP